MLFSLILSTALISAPCQRPVTYLAIGEPAPCNGFLFSTEKELELRLMKETFEYLEQRNQLLDTQVSLLNKKINSYEDLLAVENKKTEIWKAEYEKTYKELKKQETSSKFKEYVLVLTGVLITVGSGWALGQVNN